MKPVFIYNNQLLSYFCQTMTYIKQGSGGSCWKKCSPDTTCCCTEFTLEETTRTFTAPEDADWYDPDNPCSAEFAGLLIEDIRWGDGYERDIKSTFNGGLIGIKQLNAREFIIDGWIVADSECGTQYGLDWLNAALDRVSCGDDGCIKPDLKVSLCCNPEDPDKGLRTLKNVRMLTPVVEEPGDILRCCGAKIQFKMAAEVPYFFDNKTDYGALTFPAEPEANWCCPDCGGETINWPDCDPSASYEDVTSRFVQGTSGVTCFCEPVFAYKSCVRIDGHPDFPTFVNWEISTTADIRNVTIELFEDLGTGPLEDPASYECGQLAKSNIAFIPGGYTLEYESGGEQIILTSNDTGDVLDPVGVGVLESGVLSCVSGWVCVKVDACNDPADLVVSVCTEQGKL